MFCLHFDAVVVLAIGNETGHAGHARVVEYVTADQTRNTTPAALVLNNGDGTRFLIHSTSCHSFSFFFSNINNKVYKEICQVFRQVDRLTCGNEIDQAGNDDKPSIESKLFSWGLLSLLFSSNYGAYDCHKGLRSVHKIHWKCPGLFNMGGKA